ncbi:alpha/beta fold hydrolase [Piscinibacter gummiphilus]|uniref:alpha/beta fold hydrolase n=1 Tax=Piscinibacter gummiphilus TaxID=946333 RepID=UPI0012FD5C15|nr:alpha/beta hydrolase [Piscinibacter gummiphilus]
MSEVEEAVHPSAHRQGEALAHDGRRIAWTEVGAGETALLFLHGWCCDQSSWRHQMAAFADRFRCVSLDLAGHGRTSAIAPAETTLVAMASDVHLVREALGLVNVFLVGHSMGGPVAVEAARHNPDGVLGIVGVDTLTDARMYARRPEEEIATRLEPLEADLPGSIAGLVRMITLVDRNGAGVVDELTATMASVPPSVAIPSMRALLAWDIDERWPRAGVSVQAINSRALIPLIEELPRRERLTVRTMADVGHFPMLEDPDAFNAELSALLGELPWP